MKRAGLYLLIIVITAMASCSKDKNPVFLDPDSKISLIGINTGVRSTEQIDTIDIVVRHADYISFRDGHLIGGAELPKGKHYYEGTSMCIRDFENKRFLFGGGYVIVTDEDHPEWSRLGDFINVAEDVVFTVPVYVETGEYVDWSIGTNGGGCRLDTLGYIPNKILKQAQQEIKEAYARGDYETCYKLFDTAFKFYPITGPRWRALKEAGIE